MTGTWTEAQRQLRSFSTNLTMEFPAYGSHRQLGVVIIMARGAMFFRIFRSRSSIVSVTNPSRSLLLRMVAVGLAIGPKDCKHSNIALQFDPSDAARPPRN